MKIVAGMGRVKDYERLVAAGADEVFCGFVPHEWNKEYKTALPLNRREVLGVNVQISNYRDMEILADMQAYYKVPVTVTFNAITYHPKQYPKILSIMEKLCSMGFEEFIVADLNLLLGIKRENLPVKLHISGEFGEYNSPVMELLEEFVPKRYIFHRKITPKEMRLLIHENHILRAAQGRKPAEFEAFFLNENCHYTGAYCNSLHCDELMHICHLPYEVGWVQGKEVGEAKGLENNDRNWQAVGSSGCGICALPALEAAGVTHLKIVGRGKYIEQMEEDVKLAAMVLGQATSKETGEWQQFVKEKIFSGGCSGNCYY